MGDVTIERDLDHTLWQLELPRGEQPRAGRAASEQTVERQTGVGTDVNLAIGDHQIGKVGKLRELVPACLIL